MQLRWNSRYLYALNVCVDACIYLCMCLCKFIMHAHDSIVLIMTKHVFCPTSEAILLRHLYMRFTLLLMKKWHVPPPWKSRMHHVIWVGEPSVLHMRALCPHTGARTHTLIVTLFITGVLFQSCALHSSGHSSIIHTSAAASAPNWVHKLDQRGKQSFVVYDRPSG
jgi:hypothetical protein